MGKKVLRVLLILMSMVTYEIGHLVYGEYREYSGNGEMTEKQEESAEYHKNLLALAVSYSEYAQKVFVKDVELESIKFESQKFLLLVNDLDLIPRTSINSELHNYSIDLKIQAQSVADYMIDYANSGDTRSKFNAKEYLRESVDTITLIEEMAKKYNLE